MRALEGVTGCASTNRSTSAMAASESALVLSIFMSRSSPVPLFTGYHVFDGRYSAASGHVKSALTITTA
ncbi:hypothetical protein ACSFA3_20910 [Variovorax sp. RHLX14]|uniref:hypothetical protein n=1 Tax=Variovorax sp. RHLX14 TaxID=1259731 RepID=UPI003F44E9A0